MEHRIIFATSNEGKMREVREILKGLKAEVLSMKEAGVSVDIVEDGDTFEANAKIKARAVWEKTGGIVLADDSGLAVDYLNGEPGVYSARYMGEETSYEIKNWNLIHRLKGVEREKAHRPVCLRDRPRRFPTGGSLPPREPWKAILLWNRRARAVSATIRS